ncbi:MAG: excinuclease ABC subunit UvrA [Patescibacteria group bacterium]
MNNVISVRGAREHNLKNIDIDIPKNALVVISGISGSGKSSLAFDTIYAEGQRRYIESLSSYARQFLSQGNKPDVDSIEGLSPAISIDQKSASHNPRSTVGTVTEIYDYLRLLYAKIGLQHCVNCGHLITQSTIDEVVDHVMAKVPNEASIRVLAPVVRARKGEYLELIAQLKLEGHTKFVIDDVRYDSKDTIPALERYKQHSIAVEIDAFSLNAESILRLQEAIELAAQKAEGGVSILINDEPLTFNLKSMCSNCGEPGVELEPRLFSFNSPIGACEQCEGLGVDRSIDPELILPDDTKTIAQGAFLPWDYSSKNWYGFLLRAVCEHFRIEMNKPVKNLSDEHRKLLLDGTGKTLRIPASYYAQGKLQTMNVSFRGLVPMIRQRWRDTESEATRQQLEKYMTETPCGTCRGSRLRPSALLVTIGKRSIAQLCDLPVPELREFFKTVSFSTRETTIAERVLKEIDSRLLFLDNVGLGYLSLNRSAATLAGGEAQRIRLASQIGSRLTGVLYVLDEPSIGLHARDNTRLLTVLKELRDIGNSVIVVEHDEETIREADHLIDIGPGAGRHGGHVIAQGTPDEVALVETSLTGQHLAGTLGIAVPEQRRSSNAFISVVGAREHNLQRATTHIPLGTLTCITGVSGSGKSTLAIDVLYNSLARTLNRSLVKPGKHERVEGAEHLKRVVMITQSPIGRTPRSNPATYTGVLTPIRELFATTRDAKIRGYAPGRFSFNVKGGRCENCEGEGVMTIEMQFLPDVYLPCDVCKGKRFNRETLNVRFAGKSIADILELTVEDAALFFADLPRIADTLEVLKEVGMGYIQLGQSATTLSGGEAQRVKLAAELARRGRGGTLYILDEPTTGLHIADIKKLLHVLNRLVDQGNSVLVIEHNLDVVKTADWVIDLGPEGGAGGGKIVATGTPEDIIKVPASHTGRYLKALLKPKR